MKKKGRKTRSLLSSPRHEARGTRGIDSGLLHFRLCHVCLYLNESTQEVSCCRKCGEAFVPNEDHEADEIHLVAPTDPFSDWDQDEAEVSARESAEEDDSALNASAPAETKLNGLRVRW